MLGSGVGTVRTPDIAYIGLELAEPVDDPLCHVEDVELNVPIQTPPGAPWTVPNAFAPPEIPGDVKEFPVHMKALVLKMPCSVSARGARRVPLQTWELFAAISAPARLCTGSPIETEGFVLVLSSALTVAVLPIAVHVDKPLIGEPAAFATPSTNVL